MSLAAELSAVYSKFYANAPAPIKEPIIAAKANFISTFDPSTAIKPGDTLPAFTLPDALGHEVTSASLLAKGPLLISFYRGEWCPFCNLALRSLQKNLDTFTAHGVNLVAISPELPNQSLSTTEKHDLKFSVLSDVGNAFARKLGIVFEQPDSLRPVFEKFGHDLVKRNGDDTFVVPVPATILVDKGGKVREVFLEADYTKRVEPETVVGWIEKMEKEG